MKRIMVLAVVFSVMLIGGCATWNKGGVRKSSSDSYDDSAIGLLLSESLKFDDVPVPAGFRLNVKDSFAFQNNTMRVGVLTYRGKADPQEIINFYKEQMPLYNWRLLNLIEHETVQILFDKADETCVIILVPGRTSTLKISVAPKSKGKKK
ncbi:MAG: hypothetical protein U9Q21_00010 [Candidatus Auribacterota bacterium]|nr:hypothetical protein [Candidatus Auribacterota bacterium]